MDGTQRFCRSCGAGTGVTLDHEANPSTPGQRDLGAPHAARRSGFPRWGWTVVAICVAAVGVFVAAKAFAPAGGSPAGAAVSSSTPKPTVPSPSASPQSPPAALSKKTASPDLAIPVGWTLWKSKNRDVIAVRRIGSTIQIASPATPCFTGESTGTSTYRGGGFNQGGTYSKETWTVRMLDTTHLSTSSGSYSSTWQFVNASAVNSMYGSVNLADLQLGC